MRLQYFGSSTQEGQFAAMLSDRALGIMEMRSQVNQDEMCSSNTSELKGYVTLAIIFSAILAKISNHPDKQVGVLFRTYSNFDVIYRRFSSKSHHWPSVGRLRQLFPKRNHFFDWSIAAKIAPKWRPLNLNEILEMILWSTLSFVNQEQIWAQVLIISLNNKICFHR